MLTTHLHQLLNQSSLTQEEAESAMNSILEGADPLQTAAFLAILRYRGETVEEVTGMVKALEKKAVSAQLPHPTLDIVGTGGDLASTVNISTGSAILAAACGIPIAKHGNRSVSSRSGSADVLEALGIQIEVPPDQLAESLQELNIAFMYAPFYHPSLKKVGPIRRGLRFPTVFNILGPLLNPAKSEYALIGVAKENALELVAKVILQCGVIKRALVFHGCGLDELTSLGPITAYHVHEGNIKKLEIDPVALGFSPCSLQDLQGGDASLNARILKEVFAGKDCPVADALILNAGAALWIFGRAPSLEEGIRIARSVLKAGKALSLLEKWETFSRKVKLMRKS
ncbi:MAG: Anthranilate phosphoribosyltransferase [Chlamydiae bacterium]|nr:Anthranilate phosphoribosyltransferase [Chlamydiota bacterium]